MNKRLWILVLSLGLGPAATAWAETSDDAVIRGLNDDYLRAFLACDVARYRELLADDFHGVLADGRSIDKAEFLRQAALPAGATEFKSVELLIRVYGDAAIASGRVSYKRPSGSAVQTRYVDVYLRRQGRWQIVSAQSTRIAAP